MAGVGCIAGDVDDDGDNDFRWAWICLAFAPDDDPDAPLRTRSWYNNNITKFVWELQQNMAFRKEQYIIVFREGSTKYN